MSDKLPDLIDPLLLCERKIVLSGSIKIAALERLSDLAVENNGDVKVELAFSKEGKRAIITGRLAAALTIECQACLQTMQWPLDISFKLGVVTSVFEADQLEIECEPLIFESGRVSLNAIVEDEILLALPDYPKHEYDCIKRSSQENRENIEQEIRPKRADNPFSVLAKLKKTGD